MKILQRTPNLFINRKLNQPTNQKANRQQPHYKPTVADKADIFWSYALEILVLIFLYAVFLMILSATLPPGEMVA